MKPEKNEMVEGSRVRVEGGIFLGEEDRRNLFEELVPSIETTYFGMVKGM